MEVEGLLITGKVLSSRGLFLEDFKSKTFREFTTKDGYSLRAYYNGLMWFQKFEGALIPTFVDLQDPHKVYSSASKAIAAASVGDEVQCSRSRAAQFCIGVGDYETVEIVDKARGTITTVQPPWDWRNNENECTTFVGWLNGQFHARVMHPDVAWGVQKEHFQKYDVPGED